MKLTRFLYNFYDVKYNLFLSILRHNEKETLFWITEIFYSGFEEDLRHILINTFETCFSKDDILKDYVSVFKKKIKSKVENTKLFAYATLGATMSQRKYNLETFLKDYYNLDVAQKEDNYSYSDKLIEIKKDKLKCFNEIKADKTWKILKEGCKFPIKKEYAKIFNSTIMDYDEAKSKIQNNWIYFCKNTPLWIERINACSGELDKERELVLFEDDEKFDEFYNSFGYEPDEQSNELIEYLIGEKNVEDKDIMDFCNEFKLEIEIKNTIKLNFDKKKTHNYYKTACIQILKDWFRNAKMDETENEISENKIKIVNCNVSRGHFPIAKLEKRHTWQTKIEYIEDLRLFNLQADLKNMKEEKEALVKDAEQIKIPNTSIDFVVCLNNKNIGFDILYPGYENVPTNKINILKKNKVKNFYQVKADWILSNYDIPKYIEAEKIL